MHCIHIQYQSLNQSINLSCNSAKYSIITYLRVKVQKQKEQICLNMPHTIDKKDYVWQHQQTIVQLKCQLTNVNETSIYLENGQCLIQ